MPKTFRISPTDRHPSSNALLGAALLHLIPGLLRWSIAGLNFDFADRVALIELHALSSTLTRPLTQAPMAPLLHSPFSAPSVFYIDIPHNPPTL